MAQKNSNKFKMILGIILFIIIVICVIVVENSNNNTENEKLYESVNIDSSKLNIFYFNVGQADCTLITINNKSILIDAGNKSDGEYIVKFLKAKKLDKIDYFVITHGDMDHSAGANIILNNCIVKQVFMPEGIKESQDDYEKIKEIADTKGVKFSKVDVGDKFYLGTANFEVLSVKNNTDNSANDSSIVIQFNYLETSYLFMGDATQEVEEEIKCNKVDVLKVGHHGSESSTSSKFLKDIQPTYAVISAGHNKKYNHPKEEVLQRLKEAKINEENIYITKYQGTIWLTSDGTNIDIQTCNNINLDGTGQIGQMSIYNICSFFIRKGHNLLAYQRLYIFHH